MNERQRRTHMTPQERSRLDRWEPRTLARVIHPDYGMVVVPHRSNLAALMNAAEVWGCDWVTVTDAEVWRAEPGDVPAPMPYLI